jgi:hypothetical protein
MSEHNENTSLIEVTFNVTAPLAMGEEVRVSGTCPALGSGDPLCAVALYTTPHKYPVWSNCNEAVFVPGAPHCGTYRYCVYSGGKFKRWEGEEDELVKRQFHINEGGSPADSGAPVISTKDTLGEIDAPGPCSGLDAKGALNNPIIKKSKTFFRKQVSEWMRKGTTQNVSQLDGVLIVSFFLPVILEKSQTTGKWSVSWDTENLLSFQTSLRVSWIGLVRHPSIESQADKNAVIEALGALRCYPIFLNQSRFYNFYNVFCKKILWPVLHHVGGVYAATIIEEDDRNEAGVWRDYMLVSSI